MELSSENMTRFSLVGEDKEDFILAMLKIYKEVNRAGFNSKFDLTRDELYVFNDVVKQIAKPYEGNT